MLYIQSQLKVLKRFILKCYSYCMTHSSCTKWAFWAKKNMKWVTPVDRGVPRKQALAKGNDVPHADGKQKVLALYPEPLVARAGHWQWCVPKHLAHCPFKCLNSNTLFRRTLPRFSSTQPFVCSNIMFCFLLSSWNFCLHTTSHFLVVILLFCSSQPLLGIYPNIHLDTT